MHKALFSLPRYYARLCTLTSEFDISVTAYIDLRLREIKQSVDAVKLFEYV